MRAKFKCDSIIDYGNRKEAELTVVTSGNTENQDFSKYTPSGDISIVIDKSGAIDYFQPGKEYYVDFTEAEE